MREVSFKNLLATAVLFGCFLISSNKVFAQDSTSSGEFPVNHANGQCHDNACSPGCAACQDLVVNLPPGAQVTATHCFTTANYPNDTGLHEVQCTQDNAWSIFVAPQTTTLPGGAVTLKTIFYNRSHNRGRTVKFVVDWHLPKA